MHRSMNMVAPLLALGGGSPAWASDGQGAPQDDVLAHLWLNFTAAGVPARVEQRDMAVKIRNWLAKKTSPKQNTEAQTTAHEW